MLSTDTGDERIVFASVEDSPFGPDISPDGQRIAFSTSDGRIFTSGIDGKGRNELTDPPTCFDSQPAWSPDGTTIALTRTCQDGDAAVERSQLYVVAADGGVPRPLINGTGDSEVDWSQDGSHLVFTRSFAGGQRHIMLADSNGAVVRQLTSGATENFSPSLAPDGSAVAFVSTRDGNQNVYVISIDGRTERRLTDSRHGASHPAWRP